MKVEETFISGLKVLEPRVFGDSRGYFFESYNKTVFKELGIDDDFVQDNQSRSSYGVIRGLHFQKAPHAQSKLVRVIEGAVYDVAVDLRRGSETFGKWFGVELSAENNKQLYIPEGFAHGFSVLSETAIFSYKCNNFYAPEAEGGILYNDPELNIDWKIPEGKEVISEKDLLLSELKDAEFNFQIKL